MEARRVSVMTPDGTSFDLAPPHARASKNHPNILDAHRARHAPGSGAPIIMLKFAATYILTLVLMLVIDGTWIALVALPMFQATLGPELLTGRIVPGVLFYLVYAAGIRVFVLPAGKTSWPLTALYGALFGLFTYATYDLTNFATLKAWTLALAVSDIAWGMTMTALVSTLAMAAGRRILRQPDK